jgi:hypothetical protein
MFLTERRRKLGVTSPRVQGEVDRQSAAAAVG